MTKTPEETKKGLDLCARATCGEKNADCPYECGNSMCIGRLQGDALALIQQLEAERDAAVADIPRACGYCKYYVESANECTNPLPCACVSGVNTRWEWRGVQKED